MVSGTAAVSYVGQAFEPDVLALRGQRVRLESVRYGAFQPR